MPNSIFESKKTLIKLRTISLKVDPKLFAEIEQIKTDLAKHNPDMKFNINAIAEDAINKAVKKAKRELASLKSS